MVLLSLVAYRMYQGSSCRRSARDPTRLHRRSEWGNIANLQIIERSLTGELKSKPAAHRPHETRFKAFKTNILGDGEACRKRCAHEPEIEIEVRNAGFTGSLLFTWLPLLMIFGVWLFLLRQMQAGGRAALKSARQGARAAREHAEGEFKDVAGCDEAKAELQEIIEFLKEPQKFSVSALLPKGALLLGLRARARRCSRRRSPAKRACRLLDERFRLRRNVRRCWGLRA